MGYLPSPTPSHQGACQNYEAACCDPGLFPGKALRYSREESVDFPEDFPHADDFLRSVVKVKACPRCCRHAQLAQKRLSAVMTASQGEAILIRHADDIVRMNGSEHEAHHSGAGIAGSKNLCSRNLLDHRAGVEGKLLVVLEDSLTPDLIQIVGCAAQTDRLSDRRRACFEAMGRSLKFALRQGDTGDHFAPAVEGLHRFKDFPAPVKNSRTGGAAHFVARERQEITADLADIERLVAGALCRVDERDRSDTPGSRT